MHPSNFGKFHRVCIFFVVWVFLDNNYFCHIPAVGFENNLITLRRVCEPGNYHWIYLAEIDTGDISD